MHSDDGYSALADDLGNIAKRVSRLEAEAKPQDQVRDLNETAAEDANLIQSLYRRIDEANETTEQFKRAADELNTKYWAERSKALYGAEADVELREKVGNLETAIRRRDDRITQDADLIADLYRRINEANETAERFKKDFWAEREAGAEAGAEMAKLRDQRDQHKELANRLSEEITRQQDRSLALLGSLRESHTRVKNQKRSLADMNSAHDKALDRIEELKEVRRILDDRNRELTSDANLAFTYEAQLTQAKAEMADAGAVIGSLRNQVAGLGDQLKHERQAVAELGGQLRRERGARKKLGEDLDSYRDKAKKLEAAIQSAGVELGIIQLPF